MPRTFDIKTRKDSTPGGTSNPCGICRRQFAKYTCPACNLQYCSLVCYRSESHSQCIETFYKTALAEQIQGEPTRSNEEKRQMLELLKRFEEEAAGDSDEEDDADDIVTRLEGIDLDIADHDAIWEVLTEDEKQKFLKLIANPSSEGSQQLLDAGDLTKTPWWNSEDPSENSPAIRPIPDNLLQTTQFNPMLLFNVFHLGLSYAYTTRTFGVSVLSPTDQSQDEAEAFRNVLLPLSPFLADRKSTLLFTSVDGVITDWTSRLPEASSSPTCLANYLCVKPQPPATSFIHLLLSDAQTLFQSQLVVDTTGNSHSSCMRFLSDILSLVDGSKKHVHVAHKLTFYLAMVSKLPVQASKDLIQAVQLWETKNRGDNEVAIESPVRRKVLVEEL